MRCCNSECSIVNEMNLFFQSRYWPDTLYKLSDSQGEDAPPTLQAALQLTLLYNKAGQFEDALDIGEELVGALEDNFI